MNFTDEQQKVITTRNKNILVSAAAGSGKTTVLVERIMSMITDEKEPVDIDRFLIVTFTNAAAADMRQKIHTAIVKCLEEKPTDAHLQKQATLIHNAQITTIDSFCLFLLRNHFHEIALDPAFRVGDEGEIKLIEKEVLADTLEQFYQEGNEEFLFFTDAYCPEGKDGKIEKLVEKLHDFSMSHPWPKQWLKECKKEIDELSKDNIMKTCWMEFAISMAKEDVNRAIKMAESVKDSCQQPSGPYMYEQTVCEDLEMIKALKEGLEECKDSEGYQKASLLIRGVSFGKLSSKKDESVSAQEREIAKNLRNSYKNLILDLQKGIFLYDSLDTLVLAEREAGRLEKVLIDITLSYMENLAQVKKEKNVYDFPDIEHMALEVLLDKDIPTKTALMYRDYYKTVMIDEYQDSNMVQEYLLDAISVKESGKGNRFMVGDMKQSIYRFRMARPEIFMERYKEYKEKDQENSLICLTQNFRSRDEVLDATNDIFAGLMRPEIGGITYDDEASLHRGGEFTPANGCKSELNLVFSQAHGKEKRMAEAHLIANRIKKLMEDFEVEGRPVTYRDIVILVRASSGVASVYRDVLISEGIPSHVTSKEGYFSASEVSLFMDLLRIMNNPYHDIAFCSVATSLFFNFTDEELALITAALPRNLTLYERFCKVVKAKEEGEELALSPDITGKVERALEVLDELRHESVIYSMTELVQGILKRFHYIEYVSALPAGEQRKANVEMLVQRAADYEKTSYHGLFSFLRYIEQLQKYEVDFGEAAILTETENVVRIMTIHKSKGLEFPICFVAGMDKRYNISDTKDQILLDADWGVVSDWVRPNMHTKGKTLRKDMFIRKMKRDSIGEELRVLYVAMTRAKDKLIMTGVVREGKFDEMELKAKALSQEYERTLPVGLIEDASGFLEHVICAYSKENKNIEYVPVSESDLKISQMKHISGKRVREEYLKALDELEGNELKEEEGMQELMDKFSYQYPHKMLASLYTKTSVSEIKHAAMLEEDAKILFETEDHEKEYLPAFMRGEETRNEGAARGSAMHRVLELLDFSSYFDENLKTLSKEGIKEKLIGDLASFVEEGRLIPEYRRLVMEDKIACFLQTDIARRMASAQRKGLLFKEQPFVISVSASLLSKEFPQQEKVLVQGIIDVWFEEEGEIIILDYKTDRISDLEELKNRYKTQLDYYEDAVDKLTQKNIKEKVLYSFALMDTIGWK